MPKLVSIRPAYKILTSNYSSRTLLFFASYADFLLKKKVQSWSAHLKLNCSSHCYTQVSVLEDGLNGDATNYTVRLPGYAVFSFTTRYKYKRIEGSLGIENLFNNRYECGGATVPIRQKGRWISASILYNF